VALDVCSEPDAQSAAGVEHRMGVSGHDGAVEDGLRGWDGWGGEGVVYCLGWKCHDFGSTLGKS
jgi:hypothetical protein